MIVSLKDVDAHRYGGLVTRRGLYDHDADFGNGYYNDHHQHHHTTTWISPPPQCTQKML